MSRCIVFQNEKLSSYARGEQTFGVNGLQGAHSEVRCTSNPLRPETQTDKRQDAIALLTEAASHLLMHKNQLVDLKCDAADGE